MSKSIVLSEKSWIKIYNHIARTYPPSVLLIREKMRLVLGFTNRTHEEWINQEVDIIDITYNTKFWIKTIHLDFYDEKKRIMFLLKYGDVIHEKDHYE